MLTQIWMYLSDLLGHRLKKKTTFTVKNDDNKQVCQFTISVIQMKHQLSTWE